MSARQPRFEVVRGDDGWFARFIAANGREVWRTSETYRRETAARNAVMLVGDAPSYSNGRDSDLIEVRTLDERTPPPAPPTIEPPYHLTTDIRGREFWHDHEYHYRNCWGDECVEGVPPDGAEVLGRFGRVTYKAVLLDQRVGSEPTC